MSDVTDEDRGAAEWLADELAELLDDSSGLYPDGVELLAKVLSEVREKAFSEGAVAGMRLVRDVE